MNEHSLTQEQASRVRPWIQAAVRSWKHHLGDDLIDNLVDDILSIEYAPFGMLIHNGGADPIFQYGNVRAREIFGYTLDELCALPSRLSAEPAHRDERERMLHQAKSSGYFDGYQGVRVRKDGRRFLIQQATIWDVLDAQGGVIGQAAKIPHIQWIDETD